MLLYYTSWVIAALSSALYRFARVHPLGWTEDKWRQVKGDRLKEIKQRTACQSNKRVRVLKKGKASLWNQWNSAWDQVLVTLAYSYAKQNLSKNSAEKWGGKVQLCCSPSKSAIILNRPFFLWEFHTAARFRWKCGSKTGFLASDGNVFMNI